MKKVNNKYIFIFGFILGLIFSITTVYAIDAYIESSKVSYDNNEKITKKNNVQDSLDELYERSGIHKEKWVDPVLNGADPVLKDPLIPVEITDDGEVYYANLNSEWYNYKKKKWANAVILIDEPTKEYTVGAKIEEDDIESYFVWIPRYQYKVWNFGEYTNVLNGSTLTNQDYTTSTTQALNKSRIIDIKFGDISAIPKMNESEAKLNEYYTHPAFTLGEKDLNGIWVGKFETGGTSADTMVVKPNVVSWRNETVKEFFNAGKGYNPDLDSHMMKNTEWGAAAYLSHSQYGIGNEVNINNAKGHYTGYSSAPNTDQSSREGTYAENTVAKTTQPWNTSVGYLASTTGNISGIYDMSGGSWEYVAAYRKGSTEANQSGFSEEGITSQISVGYIDGYDEESTTYNKRILGDATGELGPFYSYYDKDGKNRYHNSWYGDVSNFVYSMYPWFYRGGTYYEGGIAGQFAFAGATGTGLDFASFRLVLAPTN